MENHRIPSIRFKGFSDAWEQRKFGDEVKLRRGLTYSPSNITKDGVRVLRSSNIDEEYFVASEDDVFVKRECVNIPYCKNGDILVTAANGSSKLVGKHAVLQGLLENSAVHGGFMILGESNNPAFINASMSSSWYVKFINLHIAGGNGAIGNLNKNDLENQPVLFPNSEEQVKIGKLFEDLDELITLHQRKCQVLINTKKALLEKMFPSEHEAMPKIRFKGFSDAWEQRKLGEITYQSGEKNVDDLPYESYSVSNTEGFINQKEQFKYGGLVSVADKSKSIIVTPHTFAYNPARIDIGSLGYQNLDKNVIISPMYEIFKAKNEFLDDRFLWHWLKSDIFNRIVINNQEGGVRTCFNLPKFFEACITIPKSVKEQRLIGIFFDSIDQSITLHQRE